MRTDEVRRRVIVAVGAACLAALAGCSSGGGSGGGATSSATPGGGTTTTSAVNTPSASPPVIQPSATATPTGTGVAGCLSSGLRASLAGEDHATSHTYVHLVLTNIGARPCVIGGFPGVSTIDAAGHQLGAAGDRTGGAGKAITLAPGQQASSQLVIITPGVQIGCTSPTTIKPAAALLIYPPANKGSLRIAYPAGASACAAPSVHQITVAALTG